MAITLRPRHSYTLHRTIILDSTDEGPLPGFGATAGRRFERGCHWLAQLIDVSLTVVFLIADLTLAGSLLLTISGLALE